MSNSEDLITANDIQEEVFSSVGDDDEIFWIIAMGYGTGKFTTRCNRALNMQKA